MREEQTQFYKKMAVWCLVAIFASIAICSFVSAYRWLGKPFAGFLVGKARNVYPITAPGWEYYRLNLQVKDRIEAVDGIPLASHSEFLARVQAKKIGDKIVYTITRDKKKFFVTGKIKKFLFVDFFFAFLVPFLLGVVFLVIGVVVFFIKSRFAPASIFAAFCCCVGVFFINFFDAYADIRFVVFLDIGLNLLPAVFFHLSLSFPVRRALFGKGRSLFIFLVYLFFLLGWQAKVYFEVRNYAIWSILDMVIDVIMLASYVLFISVLVHGMFRAPTSILRKRSQVALVGMVLSFIIPGIGIGMVTAGHMGFVNLPIVFTLIFPFYLGYAIVRHNLFDSERIIANSAFYLVFSLFTLGLFFLLSALFGVVFSDTADGSRSFLVSFLVVLSMVTVFSYLRQKFQNAVDRFFYRSKVEMSGLLKEIGLTFRSLFRLTDNTPQVLEKFLHYLGVTRAAVFFSDVAPGNAMMPFYDINMCGRRETFTGSEETIAFLERNDQPVTPHDIEEQNLPEEVSNDLAWFFDRTDGLILTPIVFEGHLSGFLIVGEKESGQAFRARDIEVLRTLSGNLAVARENSKLLDRLSAQERTEKELEIATNIQQSFLPRKAEKSAYYKIAFHYQPARQVGGDLFDFFQLEPTKLGLVVGDVSGKGIPAALFGAVSSGIMKASWENRRSAATLLSGFNRHLSRIRSGKQNLSLSCMVFNFESFSLQLANAGFPYPVHASREKGTAELVEIGGMPLATMAEVKYKQKEVSFKHGDLFVFYSDGIIELKNAEGEFFSFSRLVSLVEENIAYSAEKMLKKILSRVQQFSVEKELPDDQTLIVVEIL